MSEHPRPPLSEVARTAEVPDIRAGVIGAFNRTLDKMQHERDGIMDKVKSEGAGFLTDHDRSVVLGHDYAVEGAKKLSGSTRLNDDVKGDTFEVEVEDRTTGAEYKRKEGIPVGGLIRYLEAERSRLKSLADSASSEGRYVDASGLRTEASKLFNDQITLTVSSSGTSWSLMGDWRDGSIPGDVKAAARANPEHTTIEHYERNRVGTEAKLRSLNEVIRELGGESQDENWQRAAKDILEDRRELEIPLKGGEVFEAPPIVPTESALPEGGPTSEDITVAAESEKVAETRVTGLVIPEKEDPLEPIKVYVPGGEVSGSSVSDPSDIRSPRIDGAMPVWSKMDRGGRGARRELFGILEKPTKESEDIGMPPKVVTIEGSARDVTDELARKERDDPGRDILEAALAKMGSGRDRVKSFVSRLPKPGLRKALTWLSVAAGAASVILAQDSNREVASNNPGSGSGVSPIEGVAKPSNRETVWEPGSVPPGLNISESIKSPSQEIRPSGSHKRVEVEIPGQGKHTLDIRVLTGNEEDIFNVPERPQTQETAHSVPIGISGADITRAVENPQADDEVSKLIRSYLDKDTLDTVNNLPKRNVAFPTGGPEGEKLKSGYASLRGEFDSYWTETALGRSFEMRSGNDLDQLRLLKGSADYERAWRAVVAGKLLGSYSGDTGVVGFKSEGGKISDIIVSSKSDKNNIPDVAPLQTVRVFGAKP